MITKLKLMADSRLYGESLGCAMCLDITKSRYVKTTSMRPKTRVVDAFQALKKCTRYTKPRLVHCLFVL